MWRDPPRPASSSCAPWGPAAEASSRTWGRTSSTRRCSFLVFTVEVQGETARHSEPRDAEADGDAFVSLLHASGVRSRLWMNLIAWLPAPRFRVLGSQATYEKWGLDSQKDALTRGIAPSDPAYGVEPEEGTVGTRDVTRPVRSPSRRSSRTSNRENRAPVTQRGRRRTGRCGTSR